MFEILFPQMYMAEDEDGDVEMMDDSAAQPETLRSESRLSHLAGVAGPSRQ